MSAGRQCTQLASDQACVHPPAEFLWPALRMIGRPAAGWNSVEWSGMWPRLGAQEDADLPFVPFVCAVPLVVST